MSTNYLDYNGLIYLLTKVKNLLGAKLDSSAVSAWAKASVKPSYTLDEVSDGSTRTWAGKQDAIADLADIRAGAAAGATALQQHQDLSGKIDRTEMGAANGVATLDAGGKIPSGQLPSYVDDVVEVYPRSGQTALSAAWLAAGSASGSAITPEAGKIYVLMTDCTETVGGEEQTLYGANSQFRWGGSAYVKLGDGGVSPISNSEIDTAFSVA